MPSELDLATLAAELARLEETEGHRWQVALGLGLRVYVSLTPAGHADRYCLRLDFGEQLSAGPPSVTFCNPETRVEGQPHDWPRGMDSWFKPPPNNGVGWICNPWTREGRQHHSEWRARGWPTTRMVWRVVTAVQDILDGPGRYQGRLA